MHKYVKTIKTKRKTWKNKNALTTYMNFKFMLKILTTDIVTILYIKYLTQTNTQHQQQTTNYSY